jgi:hypothetical protein
MIENDGNQQETPMFVVTRQRCSIQSSAFNFAHRQQYVLKIITLLFAQYRMLSLHPYFEQYKKYVEEKSHRI